MIFIKSLYWRIRIVIFALRWIPALNLGDLVNYRGEEWILTQGVSAPVWTLQNGDTRIEAREEDFKKVKTIKNYVHSFQSGYRFYMQSWFGIWMSKGIEPWVKNLRIWKRN